MTDRALKDIIAAEKEIQAKIESERARAAEWLAREREKISLEYSEQLSVCREQCKNRLNSAEKAAQEQAAAVIAHAIRYKSLLESIPQSDLKTALQKVLSRILPGGSS